MVLDQIQGFRLSSQQRRAWLVQQHYPEMCAQYVLWLQGSLQKEQLKEACRTVIEQQEILRTAYRRVAGMGIPLQCIGESATAYTWQEGVIHDVSEIEPLLAQERRSTFHLEQGEMLHVKMLTYAPDTHLLVFTLPSICADAGTLKLLANALSAAYTLHHQKNAEDVLQYVQFSEWQYSLLDEVEAQNGQVFWRHQQERATAHLVLALAKKVEGSEVDFATLNWELSTEMTPLLEERAGQLNASPSELLQACWLILLWRLSGERDLVVGTVLDGRKYEELQQVLGPCSRCLPLRAQISGTSTFALVVEQLTQALQEAQNWQEYYCESEQPSYQYTASFEWLELPGPFQAGTLRVQPHAIYSLIEPTSLKLSCIGQEQRIELRLMYDRTRFSEQAARVLAGQFQHLLHGLLVSPNQAVESLPLAGVIERQHLQARNRISSSHFPVEPVHRLFEAQVRRTPQQTACLYQDQELSYAALDRRANQLASLLRRRGVGVEDRVALLLERGPELVIALLAVLKAGGCYIPLDPQSPPERLASMLEDTQARLILTRTHLLNRLAGCKDAALCLDAEGMEDVEEIQAGVSVSPLNLAYVLYTSGSSGRPKGSMITHQGLVNYLSWCANVYRLAEGEGALVHSPITFDLTVTSLLAPLLVGQKIILLPDEPGIDALAEAIRQSQWLSLVKITPSHLQALRQTLTPEEIAHRVRCIVIGGEALYAEQLQWWMQFAPGTRLMNEYGPTETVVGCSVYEVAPERDQEGAVPIGDPIVNMQVYLLDAYMQPVAAGVVGEIYIGGAGLARGYQGRPDLTAASFVPHPFSEEAGARLYRTGDLGRYRADLTLEYLGRNDDQVKVRGFRIEPGEIQAVLNGHPGVQESAVILRQDGQDAQLVAYAVPSHERAAPVRHLLHLEREGRTRGYTAHELPNGMYLFEHSKSETELLYREIYEDRVYLQGGIVLPEAACIFDVGANIGLFTLFASQHCLNPRLYAFEPVPSVSNILRLNLALYGIDARVFECALANEGRTSTLTYYPHCSVMSGLYANEQEDQDVVKAFIYQQREQNAESITATNEEIQDMLAARLVSKQMPCQVRTLSDVIREQNVERIDLLKIDVEKSEMEVLRGIEEADWDKIQQIVIEVHDIAGRLQQVISLLQAHGYRTSVQNDPMFTGGGLYNVYATRLAGEEARNTVREEPLWSTPRLLTQDIQAYMARHLPPYMLPGSLVFLEELPLTRNGKLDLRALPAPDRRQRSAQEPVLPRNAVEQVLADIWTAILRVPVVGIHDNFFAIGGDSILAIQAVARAKQAGILLTTKQLFQYQTIAQLATIAEKAGTSSPEIVQSKVEGRVPLTPIQHWFTGLEMANPNHFNQSVLLQVPSTLEREALRRACQALIQHHDAFRLRLVKRDNGWEQYYAAESEEVPLTVVDMSAAPDEARSASLEQHIARAQRSLNLAEGPLLRILYFDGGPDQQGRLLIVVHHLVMDGFSWRILLEDLKTAYEYASQGGSDVQLPAKTASYQRWAESLLTYARSNELEQERTYWLTKAPALPLPEELSLGPNDEASTACVTVRLDERATEALLRRVHQAYQTRINDLLLTALVLAFHPWTGEKRLLITLEGHGREEIIEGLDISRTIGWFTTLFPVMLQVNDPEKLGAAIKQVKEQLRALPHHGIGYGILRYLTPEGMDFEQCAQVSFNYLGQLDQVVSPLFGSAPESSGADRDPATFRPHLLDINACIIEGMLAIDWFYSRNRYRRETIEGLAERYARILREIIEHCQSPDAGGYTPSDFPMAGLDQRELDALMSELKD